MPNTDTFSYFEALPPEIICQILECLDSQSISSFLQAYEKYNANSPHIPHIINLLINKISVNSVVAGLGHSLAVLEDGRVFAWGYNKYGQLGLGDGYNRNTPAFVEIYPGYSESMDAVYLYKNKYSETHLSQKLHTYLRGISDRTEEYNNVVSAGYSKTQKIAAATVLLGVVQCKADKSTLIAHREALTNGELGKIYKEFFSYENMSEGVFKKVQPDEDGLLPYEDMFSL